MRRTNDLGKDSMLPLIIRLAVPAMLAQLVNVLYSIIDRMYIGNIPVVGDVALAGVGVCGPIVTLFTSFATLVGVGGSILMAMKMGQKKNREAEDILSTSTSMLIILSVVLTIVFLMMKKYLLIWFGASPETFPYANTYLTIYTLGTVFAMMALGLNYFISCQGFSSVAMFSVFIGAVSNIILDGVFIFGFGMGIGGAAVATVISQMFSFLWIIAFLTGKRVTIGIHRHKINKDVSKKIISLGLPPFLILATDSIILILMNVVLQKFGGQKQGDLLISCNAIVQSFMLLISGPMIGLTGGTQAVISYNFGAENKGRVKEAAKYVMILSVGYAVIMFILSRIVPQYFVMVFTDNLETISMSVWGIKAYTLGIIPMGVQYAAVDGTTALGKTKQALSLSIFRKMVFIASLVFLPTLFMAQTTFYAETIADTFCGIITGTIYYFTLKKYMTKGLANRF